MMKITHTKRHKKSYKRCTKVILTYGDSKKRFLKEGLDSALHYEWSVLREVLECIKTPQNEVCLFGGAIRDLYFSLMVNEGIVMPKDFDIVVENLYLEDLKKRLIGASFCENKFNGIKFQYKNFSFDIWDVSNTWFFKTNTCKIASIDNLPETTFLTTDSIVALIGDDLKISKIINNGLFESYTSKNKTALIDIKVLENPYPESCKMHILDIAERLSRQGVNVRYSKCVHDFIHRNENNAQGAISFEFYI